MSAKKKTHAVLFTPYLQKGEDLLWVGMPAKNHFVSPQANQDILQIWLILTIPWLGLTSFVTLATRGSFDPLWFLYLLLLWLLGFFLIGFVRFGKTYYAISTKRLFILRRHFWSSVDTDSLMLLPEHRLQNNNDGTTSICFAPLGIHQFRRKEKWYERGEWKIYDDVVTAKKIYRVNLENISQEDAETANELLSAVKNDMLDARARQLGLMD